MKKTSKILMYSLLILFAIIELYPFFWVILSSFKSNLELINNPFSFPEEFRLRGYEEAIRIGNLLSGAKNSIIYTGGTVILQLTIASAASFVFARDNFKFLKFFYLIILFGLMVPSIVGLLPLYIFYKNLGILNTHFSIILIHTVLGIPFAVFFITNFMKSIPKSLEEAAIMDGANMLWIYRKIIVPISKPSLATVGTFIALQVWNDLMISTIFADTMSMQPITVAILRAKTQFVTRYDTMFAAVVLVSVPFFIIFALFQRQVVSGVTAGAVKE